jgi:hypothetical protein
MSPMSDGMTFRPDVLPAVCANGHLSHPSAFVVGGRAVVNHHSDTRMRPCPECGADRVIPAGRYETDGDGRVYRAGEAE